MAKIFKHIIFVVGLTIYSVSGNTQSYNEQDSIKWDTQFSTIINYSKNNKNHEAIALAEEAKIFSLQKFGKNSKRFIRILTVQASLYGNIGQFENAEKVLIEALPIYKKLFGETFYEYGYNQILLARIYLKLNKKEEAIRAYKIGIPIIKAHLPKMNFHAIYYSNLFEFARINLKLGNYVDSEPLYYEMSTDGKKMWGEETEQYALILNDLGVIYQNLGNYLAAKEVCLKSISIYEKLYGRYDSNYTTALNNLGSIYFATGYYKKAESTYKEVIIIERKLIGESHSKYASSLSNLASVFLSIGKLDSAKILYTQALEIDKKAFGLKSKEYASSLNNLGRLFSEMGNYSKAEEFYNEALIINKNIIGQRHPTYAHNLVNIANLYTNMGKYITAELLYKEALVINKNVFGESHSDYADNLSCLAALYESMGNYNNAETLYKKALVIFKKTLGENSGSYATCKEYLANLYSLMGNYEMAEILYKETLNINRTVFGTNHPAYATSISNLGNLYLKSGNYGRAEVLFKEASIIIKKVYGVEHPKYATSLNILGGFYNVMGNYKSANFFLAQSLDIRKKVLGTDHPDYANSLNNLASLYQDLDDYAAADTLYKEALTIRKKLLGKDHPDYANSLNNLADLYETMGKYGNAEILQKEALSIRKKILGIKHPDYAQSLNNLACLYSSLGNFRESEALHKEALTIRKNTIGKEHPDYAVSINNLTIDYYDNKQFVPWQQLINTSIQTENNSQQLLLKNFSETEKETYLKAKIFYQNIYSSMLHYFKPQATNSFYQSTTAKQGWLLQGKQQLTRLANQSKDSSIKSLLIQWQNTNRQYAQAIQLTTEKRKLNNINLDSLQEQSVQLEKQLIAAMPALQAVITNTGFTGKEVAAKLKPKEAVVHWVSFQYKSPKQWTDSVLYAAYIITPNDTAPKFVTVFEEKQLQQILKTYHAANNARSTIKKDSSNNINADIALYNLIWKPLMPYLQNATTIYNLPAGLLHKISFAALTDSSNKSLIDSYEIHQLLSINELVNPLKITNTKNTIALFGGANYDAANATTATNASTTQPPLYRNASNNINIQFNYLQGTKTEVETVATNAKNTNWKTQSYTGNSAIEDNFKTIGGENAPKILHIATHGFYFPPTKTKPNNFITDDKNSPRDFPLLRSGLVLSGANNYWGKDTLLENQEDGIVTAQEISNLNLLNTDLVVLSACQTALGDINGSEGVYGLQRAFKMAGVKKLLMSLWEVPDAETAELMQLFYSNVFKGETYYAAFRNAQLTLKAKYKDPTKWAGFVLVGE